MVSKEEYSEEEGISVVPNPNNGNFYLEGVNELDDFQAEIIDVTGKIVESSPAIVGEVQLELKPGVYWLKLTSKGDKGITVKKIVVE